MTFTSLVVYTEAMRVISLALNFGITFGASPNRSKTSDELASPSCNPPDSAYDTASWNRCPFGIDSNAWYGLTNKNLDFVDAARQCESYGGQLFGAVNKTLDLCAYHAIDTNLAYDQMVLYSC